MEKNFEFLRNIPFLRKLSYETVKAISFVVEQNFGFEAGDCIFKQGDHHPRIMIIKKGQVQVRISRKDPETGEQEDYWMANLKEGSCINVYNSFQKDKESFFSFFVVTQTCQIDYLSVESLEELKVNYLDLSDVLKILYHRIKLRHVDDLDYFTMPPPKNETQSGLIVVNREKIFLRMSIMIKRFVIMFKLGIVKYPKAIDCLHEIRKDRAILKSMTTKFEDQEHKDEIVHGLTSYYHDIRKTNQKFYLKQKRDQMAIFDKFANYS